MVRLLKRIWKWIMNPRRDEIIDIVGRESGEHVELNWGVIRRCMEVVMKLAPPELRVNNNNYDFLDSLYETKIKLKELHKKEKDAIYNEINQQLTEEELNDRQGVSKNKEW